MTYILALIALALLICVCSRANGPDGAVEVRRVEWPSWRGE